jgi:hypothetical protein
MPNGRCKVHGGRKPEGLERSRRANWKHGHYSREAKAERSRLRAAILALRDLCGSTRAKKGMHIPRRRRWRRRTPWGFRMSDLGRVCRRTFVTGTPCERQVII